MDAEVKVRISKYLLTVETDGRGNLSMRGDPGVAALAQHCLKENEISRGRTLQHRLKAADRVAKELGGDVIGRAEVIAALRRGWIDLLSENLIHNSSKGKRRLATWRGVYVKVEADRRQPARSGGPHYCAEFDVNDPNSLMIYGAFKRRPHRTGGSAWKVKWEEITAITFICYEPRLRNCRVRQFAERE